jgi:hypothetical protein
LGAKFNACWQGWPAFLEELAGVAGNGMIGTPPCKTSKITIENYLCLHLPVAANF